MISLYLKRRSLYAFYWQFMGVQCLVSVICVCSERNKAGLLPGIEGLYVPKKLEGQIDTNNKNHKNNHPSVSLMVKMRAKLPTHL